MAADTTLARRHGCPVRRRAEILALAAILIAFAGPPARSQSGTSGVDTATSQRLTDYLRKHRLPLVGAQITRDAAGGTQVMLFGYVATSYGRSDAEARTRKFMKPDRKS